MRELTEDHNAPFALFYGETNSGKTTSIIGTAPQPIYCISVEGDALKSVAVWKAKGKDIDIKVVMPDDQEDLMSTLNKILLTVRKNRAENKPQKCRTILFDSGTHWMNQKLAIRVEDDRNEDRDGVDKGKLSAMTKTDWTEVNTINSQMSRLTDLLKAIADEGIMVIMTAQMQYDPKWNNELEAAPAFSYKEYNKALKGYFDYIGYTMPNIDPETKKVKYPPKLSFSGSQGYLVKWRGVQPDFLINNFNINKIFSWYCNKGQEGKSEEEKVIEKEVEKVAEAEQEAETEEAKTQEVSDDY